jgi:hypothetical protein
VLLLPTPAQGGFRPFCGFSWTGMGHRAAISARSPFPSRVRTAGDASKRPEVACVEALGHPGLPYPPPSLSRADTVCMSRCAASLPVGVRGMVRPSTRSDPGTVTHPEPTLRTGGRVWLLASRGRVLHLLNLAGSCRAHRTTAERFRLLTLDLQLWGSQPS